MARRAIQKFGPLLTNTVLFPRRIEGAKKAWMSLRSTLFQFAQAESLCHLAADRQGRPA